MVDERGQKNFCICKHRVYNHFYKGQIWTVPYISESLLTHCYALLLTRPIRSDVTILTSITDAMNMNNNYCSQIPWWLILSSNPLSLGPVWKMICWTGTHKTMWASHGAEWVIWRALIWSKSPRRRSQGFIMHSCPIPAHKGVLLVRQWQDGMV